MALKGVKLGYAPNQFRVRAEVDVGSFDWTSPPVAEIIEKAKDKLNAVQKEGKIQDFIIRNRQFQAFINSLSRVKGRFSKQKLSFPVAEGFPPLAGVEVKAAADKSTCFLLSLSPGPGMSGWRSEWLHSCIEKTLESLKITDQYNKAQVEGALLLAKTGRTIGDLPISTLAAYAATSGVHDPMKVVANKTRGEVYLVVYQIEQAADSNLMKAQIQHIESSLGKLTTDPRCEYRLLLQNIQESIDSAKIGPEVVGQNLPLVILAAKALPEGTRTETARPLPQGDGDIAIENQKFVVKVSKNGMQASIEVLDPSLYNERKADPEWLNKLLDKAGIQAGRSKGSLKSISDMMSRDLKVSGVVVAQGKQAYSAAEPYLYSSHKESDVASENETSTVNVRDTQQRSIVKAGQLIAEIRYKRQEVIGFDVYGNRLRPPEPELLRVNAGDDVEVRNGTQFYAKKDGTPKVTKNNVSLVHLYTHHGDVNLSTGNIYFDGPVRVLGSIDRGAVVEVGGDLEVAGSIRSGSVRVLGKIKVEEGIVTGGEGLVKAELEIVADFIENAVIEG